MRKRVVTTLLAACLTTTVVTTSSGCYGPFRLTKKVHTWNDEVSENKWGDELVFLGLVILPVYHFAMLGDAIIFNSMEFWGMENPISDGGEETEPASSAAKVMEQGDYKVVLSRESTAAHREMLIRIYEEERLIDEYSLRARADGDVVTLSREGDLVSSARRLDNGDVVVEDAVTGTSRTLAAREVAALAGR